MTLPEIKGPARLWIPLARTDSHQRFEVLSVESPVPWHKTRDKFHQNEILVLNHTVDDSNKKIADGIRILYGGSVKADNAHELFEMADIDGGLIGGASLVAKDFLSICHAVRK